MHIMCNLTVNLQGCSVVPAKCRVLQRTEVQRVIALRFLHISGVGTVQETCNFDVKVKCNLVPKPLIF